MTTWASRGEPGSGFLSVVGKAHTLKAALHHVCRPRGCSTALGLPEPSALPSPILVPASVHGGNRSAPGPPCPCLCRQCWLCHFPVPVPATYLLLCDSAGGGGAGPPHRLHLVVTSPPCRIKCEWDRLCGLKSVRRGGRGAGHNLTLREEVHPHSRVFCLHEHLTRPRVVPH